MRALLATLLLLGPATSGAAAAVDAFFLQRLQEGTQAYERRDYRRSIDALRLAAFGMLDDPPLLAGTLVRLATAQGVAGDGPGFQQTFGRLLEIEQRFAVFQGLTLEDSVRGEFEQQARKRVSSAVLQAVPAFQGWSAPAGAKPPVKDGARRARKSPAPKLEPESGAAAGPQETADSASGPLPAPPVQPPAAETEVQTPPAGPSAEQLDELKRAERQMKSATNLTELGNAFAVARAVADAWPSHRAAQLLAGEIAYRASRWREAVGYLERVDIRPNTDSAACFYYAVSLYEIGQGQRAAEVLSPCVRFLERTPHVTHYLSRIIPATTS